MRRHDRGGSGVTSALTSAARDRNADAEQHSQRHRALDAREFLVELGEVAAGDMAGLVREHADDLVRRFGIHQRAGVDEDAAADRKSTRLNSSHT